PLPADIIITEIHYSPRDLDDRTVARPDLEFVELTNDGPEAYDLSGCFFSEGIRFVFPEGSFLPGRSQIVVCRDADAVRAAYSLSANVVYGDFEGILDDSGETIELSNPQGVPLSSVEYNDRGQWPSSAAGTGHSLSLRTVYSDEDDADNWAASLEQGGTPARPNFPTAATFIEETLIANDEVWRYFKGTQAPPTSWRSLEFNDSSWSSGRTGIGFGDSDDRTVLSDMRNNYLTVFCRKTFTIADLDDIESPALEVLYDDGFIASLNGVEIARVNVAGSDFDDPAAIPIEPERTEIPIPANRFREGLNVLAVQVHNVSLDSSDLSFIPTLINRRPVESELVDPVPVVVNEGHFRTAEVRFIELYNTSDASVDLSGYWLTDEFAVLDKYRIPDGTTIGPRGFLSFDEATLGLRIAIGPLGRDRVDVALTRPDGLHVVDARRFECEHEEASEARFPDGNERFAPAAVPTPGAPNEVDVVRDVIFNEIHYHPISDSSDDEFIELFNRGDVSHDLSGYEIDGVDYTFPDGTVIGPGEYLVVAKSPERIRSVYDLDESVVIGPGYGGVLRDGGERLALRDPRGNTAAVLRYRDGGEWTRWADGRGSTLERIDPFGEESAPTNWDASDDSDRAPVMTFQWTGRHGNRESDLGLLLMTEGIAIVDDIEIRAGGTGQNLVRNGTFDSDTSTWRIEGTHARSGRTTRAGERIGGAGSLKLIAWNGDGDYKVNRVECDTLSQSTNMTLRLRARWVIGGRTLLTIGDYSVGSPDNAGIARAHQLALPDRFGTPGAINSVTERQIARTGSANVGPELRGVRHSPAVPGAGENVVVTARATDADGIDDVALFYRTETVSG
ncbi:MAG TPA: lamin tail domain-containing protein, partial [Planctomycetota bacterium]|nr:lamin tail domain-containing protein [Planctomycetota bacterium]